MVLWSRKITCRHISRSSIAISWTEFSSLIEVEQRCNHEFSKYGTDNSESQISLGFSAHMFLCLLQFPSLLGAMNASNRVFSLLYTKQARMHTDIYVWRDQSTFKSWIDVRSIWDRASAIYIISLFNVCLDDSYIGKSRMLKSPTNNL